jgi:hypothetical protein
MKTTTQTVQELVKGYLDLSKLTVQDIKEEGAESIYHILLVSGVAPSTEIYKELTRLEQQ